MNPVSMEEIKRGNPRLCLSPLRYLGKCFKCPCYVSKAGKPCDSRIESPKGIEAAKLEAEEKKLKAEEKRLKAELAAVKERREKL